MELAKPTFRDHWTSGMGGLGIRAVVFNTAVTGLDVAERLNEALKWKNGSLLAKLATDMRALDRYAKWLNEGSVGVFDEDLPGLEIGPYAPFNMFNERIAGFRFQVALNGNHPLTYQLIAEIQGNEDDDLLPILSELLILASRDQLRRLVPCACGCGTWKYFQRRIGMWADGCKEAHRYDSEDARKRRRNRERLNYARQKEQAARIDRINGRKATRPTPTKLKRRKK